MDKTAIVLCSGGLDSVVCLYLVKKRLKYNDIHVLFFNYGQNSLKNERKFSRYHSKRLNSIFKEINIPITKANLTSNPKKIPKNKNLKDTSKESNFWHVPGRNTLFISYALSYAESLNKKRKADIFLGFKCEGHEPYPDTTKEYVDNFNALIKNLTKYRVSIKAPLIDLDKENIILLGEKLNINYDKTWSCYLSGKNSMPILLGMQAKKSGFLLGRKRR